jgi:hypothetical protein
MIVLGLEGFINNSCVEKDYKCLFHLIVDLFEKGHFCYLISHFEKVKRIIG